MLSELNWEPNIL